MNRREFLKTIAAGPVMIMLPSLAASSSSEGLNTVEDLTNWIEKRFECYLGEPKAFMALDKKDLKKYNLAWNEVPIENKVWDSDIKNFSAVHLRYSTVAFVTENDNPEEAERQLVRALQERFEEILPQTLIWRVKPQFFSESITEYGKTWATHEQIEDGKMDNIVKPVDVELDWDTNSYKYVQRKYMLNKIRMRLVFPKQITEDYDALTIANTGRPKRI